MTACSKQSMRAKLAGRVIGWSRTNRRIINALNPPRAPADLCLRQQRWPGRGPPNTAGMPMNVSDHTTRVFDSDLIKLTQLVAQMGGFAQKQVTDATDGLSRGAPAL